MARLHGFLFWLALAMSAPAVAQAGHDDDDDRPARSGRHEPALKQNPDGTETDADDDGRPAASSPNAPGPIRDRPESGDSTVGAEDHDRQVTSNAVPPKADEVRQRTGPDPDIDHDDDDEQRAPATAIVVTARRLDTARTAIDQELGATIYELHNETIENRPGGETGSVAAILAQAPGVTLSSEGPNIRGSTAVELRINGAIVPEAISDPADRLSSRLAESTRTITGTLPAQFGFAPG